MMKRAQPRADGAEPVGNDDRTVIRKGRDGAVGAVAVGLLHGRIIRAPSACGKAGLGRPGYLPISSLKPSWLIAKPSER
jgi:hypothetical protein